MATKHLSPTANLLRHSRLFSLPPPLPRLSNELSYSNVIFESDTATLPHPIQASIETTQSSLSRGDWGLKRSLPKQSTSATTTPVIRIGAVDSIDHITEFNSAADHSLTLRKWQEMSIPLSMPGTRNTASDKTPPVSVFEENLNRTEPSTQSSANNSSRWKYQGPWLAGKSNGEFEEYVLKVIKKRRTEFLEFVRAKLHEKLVAASRRNAFDKGEELETSTELSKEVFASEINNLRHNMAQLFQWIWQFLDLPGLPPLQDSHASDKMMYNTPMNYSEEGSGPANTHASAGLSYLRTASHISNHPILGPMGSQPPVLSRILQHANARQQDRTLLGVGGVAAKDSVSRAFRDEPRSPQLSRLDPGLEGGAKGWVHPQRASIDSQGRIKLEVEKATQDAVAVWEKQLEDAMASPTTRVPEESPSQFVSYRRRPQISPQDLRGSPPPVREFLDQKATDERTSMELDDILSVFRK